MSHDFKPGDRVIYGGEYSGVVVEDDAPVWPVSELVRELLGDYDTVPVLFDEITDGLAEWVFLGRLQKEKESV